MGPALFDTLTRQAGRSQDRRASLKAFGALGLTAGLAAPLSADGKKKHKHCNKKAKKKCRKQDGECRSAVDAFCETEPIPNCHETFHPCCDFLKSCDATGAAACFLDGIPT